MAAGVLLAHVATNQDQRPAKGLLPPEALQLSSFLTQILYCVRVAAAGTAQRIPPIRRFAAVLLGLLVVAHLNHTDTAPSQAPPGGLMLPRALGSCTPG